MARKIRGHDRARAPRAAPAHAARASGVLVHRGQLRTQCLPHTRDAAGCVWIDLDERIVVTQKTRVVKQTMVVGGSWMIPEVHIFAKTRLRRTTSDHSQALRGVKLAHNSGKLLGFGAIDYLLFAIPWVERSVYT